MNLGRILSTMILVVALLFGVDVIHRMSGYGVSLGLIDLVGAGDLIPPGGGGGAPDDSSPTAARSSTATGSSSAAGSSSTAGASSSVRSSPAADIDSDEWFARATKACAEMNAHIAAARKEVARGNLTATMDSIANSAEQLPVSVDRVDQLPLRERRAAYKGLLNRYNARNCEAVAELFRDERREFGGLR